MTDWADKARVELDEFVGDLWVEDDEGGVKLYVGLDGEDAAEYLRNNFIPRARVEAAVVKERQQAGWEFVHAVSVLKKLLEEA